MTKNLFDDMIGTPPPSTVDIARIVARQDRRIFATRALGAAGAAAVAVAVVGAFALTARHPQQTPGRGDPCVPRPLPTQTVAYFSPTPVPADGPVNDREELLACFLANRLPELLPGTRFGRLYALGPLAVHHNGSDVILDAMTFDDAGIGEIHLSISHIKPEATTQPGEEVTVRSGPHGETVWVVTTATENMVQVFSGGNEIVMRASAHVEDIKIRRNTPPLSVDQLIDLACSPQMLLY